MVMMVTKALMAPRALMDQVTKAPMDPRAPMAPVTKAPMAMMVARKSAAARGAAVVSMIAVSRNMVITMAVESTIVVSRNDAAASTIAVARKSAIIRNVVAVLFGVAIAKVTVVAIRRVIAVTVTVTVAVIVKVIVIVTVIVTVIVERSADRPGDAVNQNVRLLLITRFAAAVENLRSPAIKY